MAAAHGTRSTRFEGSTVVLMDAGAFSDGKAFFEGMRRPGPSALIGKCASGAGVVCTGSNRLANGGIVLTARQGQISLGGERLAECKGVTPDIDVDNPLHSTFKGEGAQLAAAIRLLEAVR